MTHFIQIHLLTAYPPANLNRDDTGQPKTAQFGGRTRLRVSSQALKRAWRTSDVFKEQLAGHLATRTQRIGRAIRNHLVDKDVPVERAITIARQVADLFGKMKSEKEKGDKILDTEQLAFISPAEQAKALTLAEEILAGTAPEKLPAGLVLQEADSAADIAMFGRMLADDPDFNREAAVQVAHALTTHAVLVEDDFYTAVDDLKIPSEDVGAGFIGETGFAAGVFYLYICIDRDLLLRNLSGDEAVARAAIAALVEAAATVPPTGKQASFASRAKASYILIEKSEDAPRTLAAAFLKPAGGDDILSTSITALEATRAGFARAYGEAGEALALDARAADGPSLAEILSFAVSA